MPTGSASKPTNQTDTTVVNRTTTPTPDEAPTTEVQGPERKEDPKFHDAMTGRAVTEDGKFVDGTGEVEKHQVVADNWPELQNEQDSKTE